LHKKNIHSKGYDLGLLKTENPELTPFVFTNDFGKETIDFSKPEAVKTLNTALLKTHYGITFWEFPDTNLCPGVPGRVNYIHHINDLLKKSNITEGINVLDIGTGANCIYPLLGNKVYQWNYVATEVNKEALKVAETIVSKNELKERIVLKHQPNADSVFKGILTETDRFTVTVCNPPFHKSEAEALQATTRKLKGLGEGTDKLIRNFAGQAQELWYTGGEKAFLHTYLYESSLFKTNCFWYTSLVSNKDNIKSMQKSLKKLGATTVKVIEMSQGNKKSRIVAWTFLNEKEQQTWNKK
jgi:23S rRNA (adenine1618-N6)-methyltransferase